MSLGQLGQERRARDPHGRFVAHARKRTIVTDKDGREHVVSDSGEQPAPLRRTQRDLRFPHLLERVGQPKPVQPGENPVEGQDFSYPAGFTPGVTTDHPTNLDAERGAEAMRIRGSSDFHDQPYNRRTGELKDSVAAIAQLRPGQLNARSPRGDINLPADGQFENKTDDRGRVLYQRRRLADVGGAR